MYDRTLNVQITVVIRAAAILLLLIFIYFENSLTYSVHIWYTHLLNHVLAPKKS